MSANRRDEMNDALERLREAVELLDGLEGDPAEEMAALWEMSLAACARRVALVPLDDDGRVG